MACRTKGQGLLRVDPERRFFAPPSKVGLGAAERVKLMIEFGLQSSFPLLKSLF